MDSNTHTNMDMELDDTMPNALANPQNQTSWHLVSTPSINPNVESVSQKPSLKMKIVRYPANNENSVGIPTITWQATPEQIPEQHESLIKLTSTKEEFDPQESTTVEEESESITPQKRTPWYLLPRKQVSEIESSKPVPVSLVPTSNSSKQRIANKLKPQYWSSSNNLAEELFVKLENLKKNLTTPPKSKRAACIKTAVHPFGVQITTHSSEQQDCTPAKTPTLNLKIPDTKSFAVRKESAEVASDFVIAKEARKRAERLFHLKGVQAKYKSEGFKKPISSKRLVKKSVNFSSTLVSETAALDSKNNKTSTSANIASFKEARKETGQLLDFKSEGLQPKSKFDSFKIPTVPKRIKNTVVTHSTERSKTVPNHNIVQSLDFEAAKDARKKAEQLVKSGSIKLTAARKAGDDVKQVTSSEHSGVFDEILSTENVSFSSLCTKVQDTKGNWSDCLDQIYESFSKKSCKEPKEMANETKTHDKTKKVDIESTIIVSCKDISKKFLLTFLTKFGTISTIIIKSQNDAFVMFHVPNAAQRAACTLTGGAATLGGIGVQVRMAAAEDRAVIARLQDGVHGEKSDQPPRHSVWYDVAAVKNNILSHCDSRELVTYTADDMF